MSTSNERSATAAEQYAEAYATHYTERDLLGALRAYVRVIESHPASAEAGYARSQMRNIVNLVVPVGELLEAQARLALGHLQRESDHALAAVLQ